MSRMQAGRGILTEMVNKLSSITENPEREARLIYMHVIGRDPRIPCGIAPTKGEEKRLTDMVNKRMRRIPLQYLLGEWEFMGIPLAVGKGVLCPRPDSECVAECAIEKLQDRFEIVLDLCAGSGALGLAIKKFSPKCDVIAVEKYKGAFNYLEKNAGGSITPVLGDLHHYHENVKDGELGLIISNPPYIPHSERAALAPELEQEPPSALFEPSYLYFYKKIVELYTNKIKKGGYLIFEIPTGRENDIAKIMSESGFLTEQIVDLNNTVRGLCGQRI